MCQHHALKADTEELEQHQTDTARLSRRLQNHARPTEQELFEAVVETLGADWAEMTPADQGETLDRATERMSLLPFLLGTGLAAILMAGFNRSMRQAQRYTRGLYEWQNLGDTEAGELLARRNETLADSLVRALNLDDIYEMRAAGFKASARRVIQEGLDRGWSSGRIRRELVALARRTYIARSKHYWDMLAAVVTSRGRAAGTLTEFELNGVERFMVQEVMDQVTCDVCRMMHGREFTVGRATAQLDQALDDIRQAMPWPSQHALPDGRKQIMVDGQVIGTLEESGFGVEGDPGIWSETADEDSLSDIGVMAPPYHPYCRGTIVPV